MLNLPVRIGHELLPLIPAVPVLMTVQPTDFHETWYAGLPREI